MFGGWFVNDALGSDTHCWNGKLSLVATAASVKSMVGRLHPHVFVIGPLLVTHRESSRRSLHSELSFPTSSFPYGNKLLPLAPGAYG